MMLLILLFVASMSASTTPPDAKEFLHQLEMVVGREINAEKSMYDMEMTLHNYTTTLLYTLKKNSVPSLALSVMADVIDFGHPSTDIANWVGNSMFYMDRIGGGPVELPLHHALDKGPASQEPFVIMPTQMVPIPFKDPPPAQFMEVFLTMTSYFETVSVVPRRSVNNGAVECRMAMSHHSGVYTALNPKQQRLLGIQSEYGLCFNRVRKVPAYFVMGMRKDPNVCGFTPDPEVAKTMGRVCAKLYPFCAFVEDGSKCAAERTDEYRQTYSDTFVFQIGSAIAPFPMIPFYVFKNRRLNSNTRGMVEILTLVDNAISRMEEAGFVDHRDYLACFLQDFVLCELLVNEGSSCLRRTSISQRGLIYADSEEQSEDPAYHAKLVNRFFYALFGVVASIRITPLMTFSCPPS